MERAGYMFLAYSSMTIVEPATQPHNQHLSFRAFSQIDLLFMHTPTTISNIIIIYIRAALALALAEWYYYYFYE